MLLDEAPPKTGANRQSRRGCRASGENTKAIVLIDAARVRPSRAVWMASLLVAGRQKAPRKMGGALWH
jgi:hypothetical protein